MRDKIKIMIFSSLGGTLEFYDFVIFALLAKALSGNFFSGSELSALIMTYMVFAIGYLVRPIGGIILAHVGDRYGRKNVFLFSIFFMTLATFCIGFLPNFSAIGIAAPLLLSIFRILQGLSLGGEIPGAITYIYEHMPEQYRPFGGSIITGGGSIGILLGSFVIACFTGIFSEQQITSFGWRIPFILGGIGGCIIWVLRFSMTETPEFIDLEKKNLKVKIPFIEIFKTCKFSFITGFVIAFSQCIIVTSVYMILPGFMTTSFKYPLGQIFWLNTFGMLVLSLTALSSGFIISRFKLKYWIVCITANILSICFIMPFFKILGSHVMPLVMTAFILTSLFAGTANSTYSVMMADLYPVRIRYSGIAASHNFGNALAGGITPLVIVALSAKTGIMFAFVNYIIIVLVIGTFFIGLTPLCRKQISENKL